MKKLSISKKMLLAILILLPSTDFTLSAQDTLKLDLRFTCTKMEKYLTTKLS